MSGGQGGYGQPRGFMGQQGYGSPMVPQGGMSSSVNNSFDQAFGGGANMRMPGPSPRGFLSQPGAYGSPMVPQGGNDGGFLSQTGVYGAPMTPQSEIMQGQNAGGGTLNRPMQPFDNTGFVPTATQEMGGPAGTSVPVSGAADAAGGYTGGAPGVPPGVNPIADYMSSGPNQQGVYGAMPWEGINGRMGIGGGFRGY